MQELERMRKLITKLNEACVAYYKYDKPIMDDMQYDLLYDELENLEQATGVVIAGSPTQKVQGYVLDGFQKVTHSKPMLSAAKTKNINEINNFAKQGYWYCSGKLDGCFPPTARVKMADGTEKYISDIQVGDLVCSFDEQTKICEPKKVLSVFYNGKKQREDWMRIQLFYDKEQTNPYYLKCTKNHLLLTENGWVSADNIKVGDILYRYEYIISQSQKDLILGMGLGDGWILIRQLSEHKTGNVECHYSKVNKSPYSDILYKVSELFNFNNPRITSRKSGYGSEILDINLHSIKYDLAAKESNRNRIGLTFSQEVLNNLTPLSLAILYIDDGSRCTCKDDGSLTSNNKQVRCRIALNRHPLEKALEFSEWMRQHKYYNRFDYEKDTKTIEGSGSYIELSVEGTNNFFDDICKYIPKELRKIKLGMLDKWQNCEEIKWWLQHGSYGIVPSYVSSVKENFDNKERPTIRPGRKRAGIDAYDLEIEDNHTYIVNNIAVHNCTLVTVYENGEFVRAITRGNGTVGEDVTEGARFIENLPMKIPYKNHLELRGECVMSWDEFNRINETLVDKYSHPRNLAAGTLRQLDLNVIKERKLSYVVFECVTDIYDSKFLELHWLDQEQGFETVIRMEASECDNSVFEVTPLLTEHLKTNKYPYDGLVFELDDKKLSRSLKGTEHHENCRMALKWADNQYETILRDVEWNTSKSGTINPVAVFDEVDLDGAITSRATLHNISYIKDLELGIGDTITVIRSNMVIPRVEDNLTRSGNLEIPSVCPACGHPAIIKRENDSEVLYCSNEDCPGRLLGKWTTFVSKKGMDIDGLSEATLERFLKLGYLNNCFATIYELEQYKKELYKLDGFGKKSIDNLLNAIENSKSVDLLHFLVAFSIPGWGEGQCKLLVSKYKTFEEFAKACDDQERFDRIPGIGPVLNANLINYWVNNNWQMIDVAELVRFKEEDFMNPPEGNFQLTGKTFCITGSVSHYKNRDELQKDIEKFGGKVASSVSKNTNYLINNDKESASSKNIKAKSLGVQIISEEDFLCLIK